MAHTLGEIRKQINAQTATDARKICDLFLRIAEQNPQTVIDVFSNRMKNDRSEMMVQFYRDNATYLKELFDCR